ncbi:MAG: response regulator [Lachnotalea sp.]
MLNIILCDDDRFILNLAGEQIENEILKNHLDAQISCKTAQSYEVFQYLKNNDGAYLIFLDLDFGNGKLNGIDVAKQVKVIRSNAKVVFVTNHHEMAMQVLSNGVEPFGFLEKTTDMKQLSQGFAKYIHMAITTFTPSMHKSDSVDYGCDYRDFRY